MKKKLIPVLVLVLLLAVVLPVSAATPAPGGPFSTAFRVQNLESSAAVDCTYTFYDASGNTAATGSQAGIAAGDSMFVYVPSVSSLSAGQYSGVVGCTGKVAAVANFSDASGSSIGTQAASFNGVSSAATKWYAPAVYNNYYNYYSTVVVQNATNAPVNITLDVYQAGSTTAVKEETKSNVPAYASVSFEQDGAAELKTNVPYSAIITSTGNTAPVVTIYGKGTAAHQLYAYNPFQAGAQTFYAPVVMKNYYGNNSSIVVQNLGASDTNVTVTYSSGQSASKTVSGGSAWSIYVPGSDGAPSTLPSGPQGLLSATITSDSQPIAVIMNESNSANRAASFDGFPTGSNVVMVPALEKRYVNFNSSVTCQNLSNDPTTLTMQYFGSGGVIDTVSSAPVVKGGNAIFYQPASSKLPNNWLGSGKITASGGASIACVVNQDMNEGTYATTSMDQLQAYEGVAP